MNPIYETNIAKDLLVCDLLLDVELVRDRYARAEIEEAGKMECGLLAIAGTLQMCSPLNAQSHAIDWDILIDALEHSVSWIEENAQALPVGHGATVSLFVLSEKFLTLIATATGAWLWRQAGLASEAAPETAELALLK